MRIPAPSRSLLVLILLLTTAQAYAQETACTVDAGAHVGTPACPYQFVGATSVLLNGADGFLMMTTQCRADYGPGARMCKTVEIMDSDTLDPNAIPERGCWVRPSWHPISTATEKTRALDESGLSRDPAELSCKGWSSNASGLYLHPDGKFEVGGCGSQDKARAVACCKPIPVAEPITLFSIPIGAGALAGLAGGKGGA
ncbi:MAG: hypothetical protein JRF61_28195 [Deltaproteobacteria bacterium]|jgi:hypothetical protein|nr:hypothetical protein [Deltaproteobacteria bacterium]